MNVITAVLMWTLLILIRIPMILLGLVVVAVALPFAKVHPDPTDPLRVAKLKWSDWQLVRLPVWAWPWDNMRDGAMGDTRGRYWYAQAPGFLITPYLKQYWWLAVRNPCNNFSRFMRPNTVDVRKLVITYIGDDKVVRTNKTSWNFVKGTGTFWTYFLFELMTPAFGNRHLQIKVGHKISPKYQGEDYTTDEQGYQKGFTARINFDSPA